VGSGQVDRGLDLGRMVPVVVLENPGRAAGLVDALAAGGIRCAEITLRTPRALEAIAVATSARPELIVGAGTVLRAGDVDAAADAGAAFIVSPGLDEAVVDAAARRGLLALPGIATATELQRAVQLGLDRVKFFPAAAMGGATTIRALSAPFPGVRFLPSGGVGPSEAPDYLAEPAVFAVSGSWMVPAAGIEAGDWETIARLSAEAVALAAP
jgi:2-dehydro-3-deoxyphosphogluconate aldolase/(4S)-4-hydroxy-2-oxoglutarate aldolase